MHVLADGVPFSTQINLIQPLLNGIFHGAAYGLLGLGLVLLYKSNRIFNFAQGEFATCAAIVMVMFTTGYGFLPKLPYGMAMALGVLASVLLAMGAERAVIRPMFDRPRIVLVVATVGVALLLIGVESFVYYQGQNLPSLDDALKLTAPPLSVDQIPIRVGDLTKVGVLLVLAALSYVFFQRTATGTAILAISQDSTAAKVVGIPLGRISSATWAIAGLLGGVAGVLLGPDTVVTPGVFTGTTLTVAFAAAVLGGMTSLPGAFVGGMVMGLIEAFANADASFVPGLKSLPAATGGEATVAVFLLVVLLIRPRGLLGKEA